ncbi:molecular chaperone [Stenotrophomonas sp. HITSZ_GD]|uniref:fimbrial biogenesis chaperone n=1 Tax=Stenotrophomonas sp. HITSZ_GD TaxID=3037248 RepID=UPI00240D2EA5|nr:molecular chaperone [Stenotrophomonas sp. HITSZ_GD]MDG2526776.1 molecular chaperone [Stenotrophomonas sp. HITSZ_GD]
MGWGVAGATSAASLQLAPTSITLHAGQQADGLWLTNSGSAPMQVQARVYRWTQREGRDELQPTDDLLVSPPMRSLAAGEKQLLRVVRAVPPPAAQEVGYRVIVDELPGFDPARTGTQFVLRYSVPIFLTPPSEVGAEPAPRLRARLSADAQGQAVLELSNDGDGHAQIADLALAGGGAPRTVQSGLVGYVLSGQTMRWPLGRPWRELQGATLLARINGEPAQRPLPLAAAPR